VVMLSGQECTGPPAWLGHAGAQDQERQQWDLGRQLFRRSAPAVAAPGDRQADRRWADLAAWARLCRTMVTAPRGSRAAQLPAALRAYFA